MAPTTRIDIVPEPGTTLTYDQSFALMNDAAFRGRVQVACLTYAGAITAEESSSVAHNTRLRWAQSVYQSPAMVAAQTTPPVVMNVNIQQTGSAVTDAALLAAVQYVVNTQIL